MRSMSMYDLTLYLIVLALLEALCWWLGAWFFAALFLALYAVFAVASLRNDLILRYDRVIVVLRGRTSSAWRAHTAAARLSLYTDLR